MAKSTAITKPASTSLANVDYVDWTDDDAREVKKQNDKESEGVILRKFPVGKTVLRALPKLRDATWGVGSTPYMKIWQHGLKTTDDKFIATECLWRGRSVSERVVCPICEYGNTLSRSANPLDQERSRDYWAKPVLLFNCIVRDADADADEVTVKLAQISTNSIVKAIEAMRNPPDDFDASDGEQAVYGDFSNPTVKGFDIIIRRKGTTMKDTRYDVKASSHKELGADLMHLIAEQHDPRKYTRMLPASVMKALLDGIDEDDFKALMKKQGKQNRAADDDDDEPPRSRRDAAPKGRIVEDVEIDDDGDDE